MRYLYQVFVTILLAFSSLSYAQEAPLIPSATPTSSSRDVISLLEQQKIDEARTLTRQLIPSLPWPQRVEFVVSLCENLLQRSEQLGTAAPLAALEIFSLLVPQLISLRDYSSLQKARGIELRATLWLKVLNTTYPSSEFEQAALAALNAFTAPTLDLQQFLEDVEPESATHAILDASNFLSDQALAEAFNQRIGPLIDRLDNDSAKPLCQFISRLHPTVSIDSWQLPTVCQILLTATATPTIGLAPIQVSNGPRIPSPTPEPAPPPTSPPDPTDPPTPPPPPPSPTPSPAHTPPLQCTCERNDPAHRVEYGCGELIHINDSCADLHHRLIHTCETFDTLSCCVPTTVETESCEQSICQGGVCVPYTPTPVPTVPTPVPPRCRCTDPDGSNTSIRSTVVLSGGDCNETATDRCADPSGNPLNILEYTCAGGDPPSIRVTGSNCDVGSCCSNGACVPNEDSLEIEIEDGVAECGSSETKTAVPGATIKGVARVGENAAASRYCGITVHLPDGSRVGGPGQREVPFSYSVGESEQGKRLKFEVEASAECCTDEALSTFVDVGKGELKLCYDTRVKDEEAWVVEARYENVCKESITGSKGFLKKSLTPGQHSDIPTSIYLGDLAAVGLSELKCFSGSSDDKGTYFQVKKLAAESSCVFFLADPPEFNGSISYSNSTAAGGLPTETAATAVAYNVSTQFTKPYQSLPKFEGAKPQKPFSLIDNYEFVVKFDRTSFNCSTGDLVPKVALIAEQERDWPNSRTLYAKELLVGLDEGKERVLRSNFEGWFDRDLPTKPAFQSALDAIGSKLKPAKGRLGFAIRPWGGEDLKNIGKAIEERFTNCAHVYGNPTTAAFKWTNMRGSSYKQIDEYIEEAKKTVDDGFADVEPYKSFIKKFLFRVDLSEFDDSRFARLGDILMRWEADKPPRWTSCAGTSKVIFRASKDVVPVAFSWWFSPTMFVSDFDSTRIVVHESAHSFAGLDDEYLAIPFDFFMPIAEKNCRSSGNWGKYGDRRKWKGCWARPRSAYRPSKSSLMNKRSVAGTALDDTEKFNVVSCAYLLHRLEGGSNVFSEPPKSYYDRCCQMDGIVKPAGGCGR